MEYVILYLLTGALAGLLAGLLGVGGGLIIVPVLSFIFIAQGFPAEHILHLALGTSLASILFTSIASLWAHYQRGAVNVRIVRAITPGILAGTLLGAAIAAYLSTVWLKWVFVIFAYYVAIQLFLNIKPKPSRQLPGSWGMFAVGNLIGSLSSLVGIGGGSLSVPFMIGCNVKVHEAIGTSAAIGFPIALGGTIGFIVSGWLSQAALPSHSLGFVYLPALLGLVLASILTAPLGAKLAHRLPVTVLKKLFAGLLLVLATKMALSLA